MSTYHPLFLGDSANDLKGDSPRLAGQKINAGFLTLFNGAANGGLVQDWAAWGKALHLGTAAYADVKGFASAAQGRKAESAVQPSTLAKVATTGRYGDLTGFPELSEVATTGEYRHIHGTPNLAPVATSGRYGDLRETPEFHPVALSGEYGDLKGTPRLGSAASMDAGRNHTEPDQLVTGADTRLSDARKPLEHRHDDLVSRSGTIMNGAVQHCVVDHGTVGTEVAFDVRQGQYHRCEFTSLCRVTLPAPATCVRLTLILIMPNPYAVIWPSNCVFAGGAPVLEAHTTVVSLEWTGNKWMG